MRLKSGEIHYLLSQLKHLSQGGQISWVHGSRICGPKGALGKKILFIPLQPDPKYGLVWMHVSFADSD